MKMRRSRLRRQDSVMIRVDNIRNHDIDALEPYKANKNINRNPNILYEQDGYGVAQPDKESRVSGIVTAIIVTVITVIVLVVLLNIFVL